MDNRQIRERRARFTMRDLDGMRPDQRAGLSREDGVFRFMAESHRALLRAERSAIGKGLMTALLVALAASPLLLPVNPGYKFLWMAMLAALFPLLVLRTNAIGAELNRAKERHKSTMWAVSHYFPEIQPGMMSRIARLFDIPAPAAK